MRTTAQIAQNLTDDYSAKDLQMFLVYFLQGSMYH